MDLKLLHNLLSDPAVIGLIDVISNVIITGCAVVMLILKVVDRKREK